MCQSIESIWALSATDESRNYAKFALLNIVPSLVDSVESPSPANKEKMAIGAHFAGKAINISKTTAPHAFSYFLTEKFGIPHGEAVGMNISKFIEYNYEVLSENTINILFEVFGVTSKVHLINCIESIKSKLNLKLSVKDINHPFSIDEYFENINIERLQNNPKLVNLSEVRNLLFN